MEILMSNINTLMEGAKKIVTKCGAVKPNEKVLVITDTGRDLSMAYALMATALDIGTEVAVITMNERKISGEEPPPHVAKAMLVSDVIFQLTSTIMIYTQAKMDACEKGARFIAMTGITPEVFTSPGVIDVDFRKQRLIVEKLANRLNRTKKVRFTTPRGTDITLSVEGRSAISNPGMVDAPGSFSGAPDIEVYIAPVEESVNGVAVIDGTISTSGLVKSPVKLLIKDGIVQKIEGEEDAKKLQNRLEVENNPSVYQVAELGIGLNPGAQLRGAIIEDEGALGTAHIALGDNHRFGGKNKAPVHIDLVQRDATLEFDGKIVLKEKKLYI